MSKRAGERCRNRLISGGPNGLAVIGSTRVIGSTDSGAQHACMHGTGRTKVAGGGSGSLAGRCSSPRARPSWGDIQPALCVSLSASVSSEGTARSAHPHFAQKKSRCFLKPPCFGKLLACKAPRFAKQPGSQPAGFPNQPGFQIGPVAANRPGSLCSVPNRFCNNICMGRLRCGPNPLLQCDDRLLPAHWSPVSAAALSRAQALQTSATSSARAWSKR